MLSRLTENITHIVYKSGKPQTLAWYRKQEEEERPHIVGIGWVTRSKEKGEKLEEAEFKVKVEEEDIFQKVSLAHSTFKAGNERKECSMIELTSSDGSLWNQRLWRRVRQTPVHLLVSREPVHPRVSDI